MCRAPSRTTSSLRPAENNINDIASRGQGQRQNQTGADQATPAPVPSGISLGVVIHTAMRQATQSVMKYIARKTIKLVYPPHSYQRRVRRNTQRLLPPEPRTK